MSSYTTTLSPFKHVKRGDVDYFRTLEMDVLENYRNDLGHSFLHRAARYGELSCCQVIYRRCPQLLYERNYDGFTPLYDAAYNGRNEVIKYLLTARATLEQEAKGINIGVEGGVVETILIDEELLMMVADGNITVLHYATFGGHLESVKLLLEADRSKKLLGMVTIPKNTALHLAVKYHHLEMVELLVETDPDFEYSANNDGQTPLLIALIEAVSRDPKTVKIRTHLIEKQSRQCMVPTGREGWTLLHHAASKQEFDAMDEIIQSCPDCLAVVDNMGQNFLHIAVRLKHIDVVNYILGNPKIQNSVLNGKDKNGDTPLHLATAGGSINISFSLLYDSRVRKMIMNNEGKSALDAIDFAYDLSRAKVEGLPGLVDLGFVDIKQLKDRSDFDLLVGALIATVSFTAGIMVPGGFFSDGPSRGNAILYKKRTFEAFVVFNTIALALSLFVVLSHFCLRRLVNNKNILLQLQMAAFSLMGAILAMMVAFIMGSFAVLSISPGLSITVCLICCCFFGASGYCLWMMIGDKHAGRSS